MRAQKPPPPVRPLAWFLIGFLWIAYFLNYCDRQVVYAVFPVLRAHLAFTNAELGLTGSLFIWATGAASPFAGILNERYSRQSLVVWTLVLWSSVTFLTGFSNGPASLLGGRVLLGVTEAVFIPIAVNLIGDTVPLEFRSRAVALFFSAQILGVIAGGSLGGWIAEHLGWRVAFFALGTAGALLAAPLAVFLRRFRRLPPAPETRRHSRSDFTELAKVRSFVALCCCFPMFVVVLTIMYSWLPAFLHDKFSLGLAAAGFKATAYLQTGTTLGLIAGSWISDRWSRRRKEARFWLVAAAMVLGAPWIYLVAHGSLPLAEVGSLGFGMANGFFTSNIMVAPFDVVPLRTTTTAIAMINTIAPPFSGLATFLTGVWKDRIGIANIFTILATLMLIAGGILILCTSRLFKDDRKRLQMKAAEIQP